MRASISFGAIGLLAAFVVPASAQTGTTTPLAATQQTQAQPSGMCGCCQRMAMMQSPRMQGQQGQGDMQMPAPAAPPAQ